jgi:hypothetical protein
VLLGPGTYPGEINPARTVVDAYSLPTGGLKLGIDAQESGPLPWVDRRRRRDTPAGGSFA